jgi:glutathione synthase/RimK-type ligase-like ATP-grasp enzyme
LAKNNSWEIADLQILSHGNLSDEDQTDFANALDAFSKNVWRLQKEKKAFRYDLAILINPDEIFPPSDEGALKLFIKQGKALGVNVELITPRDYMRLPEFDALFIRETTSIDHHTYRFAKKAESEGLVVIDDSKSIQLCTNKIFLADMFRTHKVPTPKTVLLRRESTTELREEIKELGMPVVIKIPDGSFSRGMVRVENESELEEKCAPLFETSSLLLAQEFLYTDFDWRIGILNNKPLYACRYYMVKNHWQIYHHQDNKKPTSGGFDTLPTF